MHTVFLMPIIITNLNNMQEPTSAPITDETTIPAAETAQEELTLDSFRKQLQKLGSAHGLQTRIAFADYRDEEGTEGEKLKEERIAKLDKIESQILALINKALDTFPVDKHKDVLMDARSYIEDSQYIFEQLFLQTRAKLKELKGKGNGVETSTMPPEMLTTKGNGVETSTMSPEMLTTMGIQQLIKDGAVVQISPSDVEGKINMNIRRPE